MKIDVNKCLPPELTVQSVDDILYRIGLTFESTHPSTKRRLLSQPLIIFIYSLIILVKDCILFSLSDDHERIFMYFDGHLLSARRHCHLLVITSETLAISSQIIYYYNYRNGKKPTFLRVFQMMSGLVSPKSLGLTDETEILKLMKTAKTLFKYTGLNLLSVFPFTLLTVLFCYLCNGWSIKDTLFYGLPNGLFVGFKFQLAFNIFVYQYLYFYILCLYLKIKINSLNERLIEMKRRKRFIRIRETLQSFDSLYSEINEYNTTFWSKILFCFWFILGHSLVINLFVIIFGKVVLVLRLIFFYFFVVFTVSYLFIIFTASSVTYSVNKSYKTLNSMFISYSKHNKHRYHTRTATKMKVHFFYDFDNYINITYNFSFLPS